MNPPESPRSAFAMGEREFVALMAMLQALQALAIDVMLPALGVMAQDLGVAAANERQLVIGMFLLGCGLGSLIPGSLADRYGRRPVVLTCLAAYLALSLACALVHDFTTLLALRLLSGMFTAGLMIMPMAIIRDRFSGDRMARTQSLISMVFMVVPMVAPTLGQALLLVAGWRWIFGVMALLSAVVAAWAWLRLPETLDPAHRQGIHPLAILSNMREAITTREAIGYFLGTALIQSALLGYINSAQQLVAESLGAGPAFPMVFGGIALVMASTNFVNASIVERFGARRVSQTALFAYIAVAVAHFSIARSGGETLWHFVPLMTASMCLMSFIGANFQAISLQPFARIAGAAASVMSFVRLLLGAAIGMVIGQTFDGTAAPLTLAMVLAGCGALALVLFSERGRLFRRLNYPVRE